MMRPIVRRLAGLEMLVLLMAQGGGASAEGEATEAAYERLLARPAAEVGAELPDRSFGDWLDETVPRRSARFVERAPCDAKAGDAAPLCFVIEFEIVSRHRRLRLAFDGETAVFRGGVVSAEEMEGVFAVASLAELPDLLRRAMRPYPLDCPPGTALRLRESYAGLFEWCEDGGGVRQGPARDWFSTGIYLMSRGHYVDGEKDGDWIECDRFERCRRFTYEKGARRE